MEHVAILLALHDQEAREPALEARERMAAGTIVVCTFVAIDDSTAPSA